MYWEKENVLGNMNVVVFFENLGRKIFWESHPNPPEFILGSFLS